MSEGKLLSLVGKDTKQPLDHKRKHVSVDERRFPGIEPERKAEWLVSSQDDWRRPQWFVRIRITGMKTRRYGAFQSKAAATKFYRRSLDHFLTMLFETLPSDVGEGIDCFIEDELVEPATYPNDATSKIA